MKKLQVIQGLAALALVASSGTASAVQVYLIGDGLRSGGGTAYDMIFDGSDGHAASTATWDWTGGVLTQTGGTLSAYQWIGSTPFSGQLVLGDVNVTGLKIDTGLGTTTATSYSCLEGNFGASSSANSCANTAFGVNVLNQSSVAYNVGGNASCEVRTIGGDDASGGNFRGLRSWDGTGCGGPLSDSNNFGRGALDMVQVIADTTGIGGNLTLANWNNAGTVSAGCIAPAGSAGDPTCGRAHWLTFSAVPVPGAVWLFGSALGLLGLRRRSA